MKPHQKSMPFIYLTCVLLLLNFKCNNPPSQIEDGGPCSYEITKYPAKILSMDDVGNGYVDLNLEINPYQAEKTDTISYCMESQNKCVSLDEIKKHKLQIGDSIVYEIHTITSGSCNPEIVVLKAEKFKN
jgi:hypothetical protein